MYRIDATSLGKVTIYRLDERFGAAWARLEEHARRRRGNPEARPAYSSLAAALRAVTGQPVQMFPRQGDDASSTLLVTSGPIDSWLLETTFRTFERLSLGDPEADGLAAALGGINAEQVTLADRTHTAEGAIGADGWVYAVARWTLGAQLQNMPLVLDDTEVTLRLDTDGNLLAWDQPIVRAMSGRDWTATVYLETGVVTLPGAEHLYFRVEPRVARVPNRWWGARNAWVARDDRSPILTLPVDGPWPAKGLGPRYRGLIVDIVQACQINPVPDPPADPLDADPQLFRLKGIPTKHPVGKGAGARFAFQIQDQIRAALDTDEPRFSLTKLSVGRRHTGSVSVSDLDDAVRATKIERLRVVCLYSTPTMRARMADALRDYHREGDASLRQVLDDVEVQVSRRVSVVFHYAPEVLAHGEHTRETDSIAWLRPADDGAVAALAETDWKAVADKSHDAKLILRRELGARGVIVQFIDVQAAPADPEKKPVDYPANAAVRDLLRQAGVIDHRLAWATTTKARAHPLRKPATVVGVHLREHRGDGSSSDRCLVVKLVAVTASPVPGVPWTVSMYDDALGWVPYRQANAAYAASSIGRTSLRRRGPGLLLVREYVDQALKALPTDVPLVILMDAQAGRGIWSGLRHATFGAGQLPGDGTGHGDRAVVRVATDSDTVRPTHQTHQPRTKKLGTPDMPGSMLYTHTENNQTIWVLSQPSRVHRGGERTGSDFTRWNLPDRVRAKMKDDWHSLGAIEISIPRRGGWEADALAVLVARLCNQAVSWDDRTKYPVPLHLAQRADLDHPAFVQADSDASVDTSLRPGLASRSTSAAASHPNPGSHPAPAADRR